MVSQCPFEALPSILKLHFYLGLSSHLQLCTHPFSMKLKPTLKKAIEMLLS